MRRFFTTALAAAALSTAAFAAPAAALTFAGNFTVTDRNTDSGLIIDVSPVSGPINFDLDFVGDSETEYLFDISTPEGDAGADDFVHQPIEVAFNFTSPTGFGGAVGGETWGTSTWVFIFNFQDGRVDWANPTQLAFPNNGLLSVSLNDTTFGQGKYGLSSKSAKVKATFTLDKMPTGVPEPATWAMMISGFGMAGATLRRRRALAIAA